jgi:hypothetical protein
MSDSTLRYWAVLFLQGTDGSGCVAVTDGKRTPHDTATVRKIIETKYGAVGPMATSELAHAYLRDATGTPEGLNYWYGQLA